MTKVVKTMKKKQDGSIEQVYIETHASGVVGLSEFVSGQDVLGVSSINKQTGAVNLSASDLNASEIGHIHANATESVSGFMSPEDKAKLDGFAETAGITEDRAKELINENAAESAKITLTLIKELN
ncbi:hypothetical protein QO274_000073 [Listeria monocytogenes]|nr:hypothetical protein [Listeria monocytogenes]